MATRIEAPTEEELADAQLKIEQKRAEEEFERNRQALEDARPKGAAKLSRIRRFGATVPPAHRGAMEFEEPPENLTAPTPAEILGLANNDQPPAADQKPKKKGKFDVPDAKNAATILDKLGIVYVEEAKKDATEAFKNLRTNIMLNLSLLLPLMPQIKQMFELLQIGEPESGKRGGENGKENDIGRSMKKLRNFLQGEPDDE